LDEVDFFIKIADLGFSKKLKTKTELRKTHVGTPLFMSPQVFKNKKYSYKVDIWSTGAILYNLITGETPFESITEDEL